jgi:hypothetical protein
MTVFGFLFGIALGLGLYYTVSAVIKYTATKRSNEIWDEIENGPKR